MRVEFWHPHAAAKLQISMGRRIAIGVLDLSLEGDDELSGVPRDLLSSLIEPVLLLGGGDDDDTVWLKVLVVVGNLTL